MGNLFRQVFALVRKNAQIKSRKKCGLILEVLLPVFILLALGLIGLANDDSFKAQFIDSGMSMKLQDCENNLFNRIDSGFIAIVPPTSAIGQQLFNRLNSPTFAAKSIAPRFFNSVAEINNYRNNKDYDSVAFPRISSQVVFNIENSLTTDYTISFPFRDSPNTRLPLVNDFRKGFDPDDNTNLYTRGFIQLQCIVDNLILVNQNVQTTNSNNNFQVTLAGFPTPAFIQNDYTFEVANFFGLALAIGFVSSLTNLVSGLVEEKELRIKEGMKMMGLTDGPLFLSWYVTYFFVYLITSVLASLITNVLLFKDSNFIVLLLLLLLFCISLISFGFFLSSLFDRSKLASALSAVIFLGSFLGYYGLEERSSRSSRLLACLSPPIALGQAFEMLSKLQSSKLGVVFTSLDKQFNNIDMSSIYAFLILDTVLFFILGWYLQNVLPSQYGVRKPVYFIFQKTYWCNSGKVTDESEVGFLNVSDDHDCQPDYVEPPTESMKGKELVQIRNLRKKFDDFTAVNNLSLDMYEGQIFSLLGHNGAGKTTTINMLTGLYGSTSGTANICGYDLHHELDKIRQKMGVCPQHDILYPNLSVYEHLKLFAAIKGVDSSVQEDEIHKIIDQVGLGPDGDKKTNSLAGTLSGGQKRKLSVAIALLGGSKVVFLDEPSSGMDVASQRDIWNILMNARHGRVIVLTTHSMEEAELGDRIAIMSQGRLKCNGSSLFLKKLYGVGYTLTISKDVSANQENNSSQAIIDYFKRNYSFAELLSDAGAEISFRCPIAESEKFPEMFENLDAHKQEFNITTFSVSVTTLTEVFLRVASEHEKNDLEDGKSEKPTKADVFNETFDRNSLSSSKLFFTHVKAIYAKRFNVARRDAKQFIWQFIYPCVILVLGLGILKSISDPESPQRVLSPLLYSSAQLFQVPGGIDSTGRSVFESVIQNQFIVPTRVPNLTTPGVDVDPLTYGTYLLASHSSTFGRFGSFLMNSVSDFPYNNVPAVDTTTINAVVYFNSSAADGIGAYWNFYVNSLLRAHSGSGPSHMVTTRNKPMVWSTRGQAYASSTAAFFVAIALSFVPTSFATFLVKERSDKVKHLHFISGVTSGAYWIANYLWDITNFIITFAGIIILLFGFENDVVKTASSAIGTIILLWLFIFASAPFTYSISFLFESHTAAQSFVLMFNFISSIMLLMVTLVLSIIKSTEEIGKALRFVFRLLPGYCLGEGFSNLYLREIQGNDVWDLDCLGYPIIFLCIDIVLYLISLFYIQYMEDYKLGTSLLAKLTGYCGSKKEYSKLFAAEPGPVDENEDYDVNEERKRIENSLTTENDVIILKKLRKVYLSRMGAPPQVAVNNLSFAVRKGECFGFLGANGAGKTTTMKMLTGDDIPTFGTASLNTFDIIEDPHKVRQHIGYCPQFDALIELLTAREHLTLYARIKCVPEDRIPSFTEAMLETMDLKHLADKPAGTYSGGNKRKLSVGIALIGNPPIVFLDEPSTGMDPMARRFMWSFIQSTMKNRSVILTTHSMEECEALCNRVGIMVLGKLRCLGTSQHLKNRHGRGYQIFMQLKDEDIHPVKDFMDYHFPDNKMLEHHGHNVQYVIPKDDNPLSKVFRTIEAGKVNIGINAYSVSDTNLEQLFIQFVNQGDEEANKLSNGLPETSIDISEKHVISS